MNRVLHQSLAFLFAATCLACAGCTDCSPTASSPSPQSDVITVGQDIGIALTLMQPYGNGGPMLAMATLDPSVKMKHWPVGDGVLAAAYSTDSNKIITVDFHLSDERPKAERMYWDFEVKSFDPETGHMHMVVPTPRSK